MQDINADAASPGLLAGKKVALKDNICLAGVPCEFGTKVFEDWVPKTDATVVTRVLEAGAVVSLLFTWKLRYSNVCRSRVKRRVRIVRRANIVFEHF